jgi:hypothetical protein
MTFKFFSNLCLVVYSLSFINAFAVDMNFDTDNNGLYDDKERKVLLDYLQEAYPELKADYDTNDDGEVSILEQTTGYLPLSLRIPIIAIDAEEKVPWALNLFPEWLTTAYFQDDVVSGPVSEHTSRGTIARNATQTNDSLEPEKLADNGGIEFTENSGQYLTMSGQRDARWNYRWCVFTFRIDANSGKNDSTVLVDINQGSTSNKSSPKIWYNKESGLNIQYLGLNEEGIDKRLMTTKSTVVADGKTWNIVVTGIRYGKLFASVNGNQLNAATTQPDRFSGEWLSSPTSFIGEKDNEGNMAWAYDSLVFGLTEPSEAMVRKMSGWAAHRLSIRNNLVNLPNDHIYKSNRPVMDAEDFPYRYIHDDDKWTEWGSAISSSEVKTNGGGTPVTVEGFERVFYDDFRSSRVKNSASGESDLWSAPGFNIAVGASATLISPDETNNVYVHDEEDKTQDLSLLKVSNKWKAGAFYSVNDLGHGYTWKGPKIFRIRLKFPLIAQDDLPGGLFPAFWSYDPDFLFWRTSKRIEVDWFEFDGQNGSWLNGLASHYHAANIDNIFVKDASSSKSYKAYGGDLSEAKSKIEGGVENWDGEFHSWEFVIDSDMTYINLTIKDDEGNDKWVEVGRVATSPIYLERLDLQIDYALLSYNGTPTSDRESFTIDSIEVLQKTSEINKLPSIFNSKPMLVGEKTEGSALTCQANVEEVTDIRYYWFANGYPLTYTVSNTYQLTSDEVGKNIRCMVKAVGALNMPEAWTDTVNIAAYYPPMSPSKITVTEQ